MNISSSFFQAAKLMQNSFYGRIIECLDHPLASAQERIKGIQETLKKFVQINRFSFMFVPDFLKTQEICNWAVNEWPWLLKYVPDQYKAKEMCDDVVQRYPCSLQFVPDWFVTQQQIKIWHDYRCPCHNEDNLLKWYDCYYKRKVQKVKIKEELLHIAWHPDRVMGWCMSEEKKSSWK